MALVSNLMKRSIRFPSLTHAVSFLCVVSIAAAADSILVELPWRYVIGGSAGGQWLTSAEAGQALTNGKPLRRYTLEKGLVGQLTAKGASPDADVCPDVWLAKLPDVRRLTGLAIACDWNPQPRAVAIKETAPAGAAHDAVREVLLARGFKEPVVKLSQHVVVDLDGDGQAEELIAATHYPDTEGAGSVPLRAEAGNYSLVLLRREIAGKVVTQVLEGLFHAQTTEEDFPQIYAVSGVLDLDGDGVMEFILHYSYYEGGGANVWRLNEKQAERVMEIDCGV